MEQVDYTDTFITVSPDTSAAAGSVPARRARGPTVASATYDMIAAAPYRYRSSEVIFTVWADRNSISEEERQHAWTRFYAQPRACLRASDLVKRFGWGIHADQDGRLALYGIGSEEYDELAAGRSPDGRTLTVRAGLRGRR